MTSKSLTLTRSILLKHALVDTIPVAFGYLPLGIAFGFLFEKLVLHWFLAPLMSILVFAGAAQFIAVSILAVHGSVWSLLLSTLLVNLRHIFYGVSFVNKFPSGGLLKLYMIFGLTDESYSILSTTHREWDNGYAFWVIFISHSYWVLGSLIGALLGKFIKQNLYFLKFSLTALFLILMIEQAYKVKKSFPFIVTIVAALLSIHFLQNTFLFTTICLSTLMLVIIYYYRLKKNER